MPHNSRIDSAANSLSSWLRGPPWLGSPSPAADALPGGWSGAQRQSEFWDEGGAGS